MELGSAHKSAKNHPSFSPAMQGRSMCSCSVKLFHTPTFHLPTSLFFVLAIQIPISLTEIRPYLGFRLILWLWAWFEGIPLGFWNINLFSPRPLLMVGVGPWPKRRNPSGCLKKLQPQPGVATPLARRSPEAPFPYTGDR